MEGTTEIFGYRIGKERIKRIADFLYLTVFALLLGYYFLVTTTFQIEWRENFPSYLRILLIVVIMIKLTYVEVYDFKEVLFAALVSICFLAVWIRTSEPLVLNTLLLILGSKGTSFEKILKVYTTVTIGLLLFTMGAALFGFTENLVYFQEGRSPRIAFGICYPTDFSAHVLYSLLAYGYLRRERIRAMELALMAGAGVFVFVFCNARVNTVCILVATGAFLYNKIRHQRAEKQGKTYEMNGIWSWLLAMSTVICAFCMTLLTVFYSSENKVLSFINRAINFRLSYGKKGVDLFGFSLIGQYIPMIGNGGSVKESEMYFFLDCSYINLALLYGIVLLGIILIICSVIGFSAIKQKNWVLLWILAVVAVQCMIEHHMMDISYNPFLWAVFADMTVNTVKSGKRVGWIQKRKKTV